VAGTSGRVEIASPAELRLRGFQALRELLERLATRRPVVLLIDDLQWGDTDSAPFLVDLVSDPAPVPILFLACYREDEAESSPLLRQLLHARGLGSSGHRIELPVEDLEPSAARDLALTLLSRHETVVPSVAEQIARESGGNPFFLAELVKDWQTTSRITGKREAATAGVVSKSGAISVDDLVRRRLANLSEPSRRLLQVIALAGQPIDLGIARDAARLEEGSFPELAQLLRERLIRTRRSDGWEEIEAYHDRIRQGTEASMPPEALQECHYRLATAWESAGRSDPRFPAIHFRGARVAEKALAYAIRAAEEAAAALAFDNAAQFYSYAAEFAPNAERDGWLVKMAEALCNAGRGSNGARVYLDVAERSRGAAAVELRRRAAGHLLMAGRIEEGLALTREVLKVVNMRVHRWAWQAMLSFFVQRLWIRARGLTFREREAAQIPAADLLRMDICASLVQGLAMVDPIRAHPFHARLLLLALQSGEASRISRALCSEAGYFALRGDRSKEKVERVLGTAQELAARSENANDRGLAALAIGMAAFLRGEWRNAAERMAAAESILRERCTGVAWEVATAHMMGSVSWAFLGEWEQLTNRLPRIIKDAEARGDLFEGTDLRTRLAHTICLAADRADQAREEIRSAMEHWHREDFDLQHWWAWLGNIETDLYTGEAQSAWRRATTEWTRLRWSLLTRVQYVYLESRHQRARAALALAKVETTAAERRSLLRRAEHDARGMERQGAGWAGGLASLIRAGVAATRGDKVRSVDLLDEAERQLQASDMALYAAVARRARGQLLDDAPGRDEAERWMRNHGISNPERIAHMLAPGF
jgi:hypothetical protein